MNFRSWLESTVKFSNVQDAIKKTLELVVDGGRWKFEPRVYGLSGMKTASVAGHFYCRKGHFFISAHTVADKPIDSYDSVTGDIDGNSKVEIIASICLIHRPGDLQKVAERSRTDGGRLNSPYQLAHWVKEVIDGWGTDNDDGDDYTPEPNPVGSSLVGV